MSPRIGTRIRPACNTETGAETHGGPVNPSGGDRPSGPGTLGASATAGVGAATDALPGGNKPQPRNPGPAGPTRAHAPATSYDPTCRQQDPAGRSPRDGHPEQRGGGVCDPPIGGRLGVCGQRFSGDNPVGLGRRGWHTCPPQPVLVAHHI